MAEKKTTQPAEHPQQAANRAAQAERERLAQSKAAPPPPHPMQAMATALGTGTHQLEPEALAAFRAGKPRVAQQAQRKAADDHAAQAAEQHA